MHHYTFNVRMEKVFSHTQPVNMDFSVCFSPNTPVHTYLHLRADFQSHFDQFILTNQMFSIQCRAQILSCALGIAREKKL